MDARAAIRRRAIILEVGGFRPPDNPLASWFGRVAVGRRDEQQPKTNGAPMHALCQINLADLPFRPPRLADLEMITLFVGPDGLPSEAPNGEKWCLRTYRDLSEIVAMQPPETGSGIRSFPMRPRIVEEDFPCWEDVPIELPEDEADRYYDLYTNVPGLKLGGWPTLIQSEIFWAPWNRHPAAPEFVFQVDSNEKAGWSWGHDGVGYFGRGTTPGLEDEWALAWQCLQSGEPHNKRMKQTKLSAAPWLVWRCRLMPAPAGLDAGTASQLIRGVMRTDQLFAFLARWGRPTSIV